MTAVSGTTQAQLGPAQFAKFLFHSASAAAMVYSYVSIGTVMGKIMLLQVSNQRVGVG